MSKNQVSESEMLPWSEEAMREAIHQIVLKHGTAPLPEWGSWHTVEDHEEAKRLFSATDAELADFFDAAHDLLLTEGWVQKAMRNGGGRCAMGAICDALPFVTARNGRTRYGVVRDQMFEVLLAELHAKRDRSGVIASWNDKPERTIDDVLDAFRRCAKTLRNKEQE